MFETMEMEIEQLLSKVCLVYISTSSIALKTGKCSKISNTFLFLLSTKMLVIRAGIHKMLVSISNREDPDQTVSSEAV